MTGSSFKHYVIALSHRHRALVIVQVLVALANTLANSFALVFLVREGVGYLECAIFTMISVSIPLVLLAFASRTIVKNFSASINTSFVALFLYYIALIVFGEVGHGWYLVLVPPVFFGVYIVTFWVPYNVLVMHVTSKKKRGAMIGMYFLIFPLLSTVAPLMGGIIISLYSYEALFGIAAITAAINLFYVSGFGVLRQLRERIIIAELLQSIKVNLFGRLHIDLDLKRVDWRLRYSLFAEGVQDGIFWIAVPLISFEFAKSEIALSGYLSLFAFWGALMTVALGYLSDKIRDRAHIVRIGAAFGGIGILLAAHSNSAEGYISSMSMAFLWIALVPSFLFMMLLDEMEKERKKGVLAREFLLNAGRALGIAFTVVILLLDSGLNTPLILAAIAAVSIVIVK